MMDPAQNPTTALAVRDGTIVATAGRDEERELLDAWRGPDSVVIDDPGLTVLPAFVDTHNHLALAARNLLGVPGPGHRTDRRTDPRARGPDPGRPVDHQRRRLARAAAR
jgi:predicted amidohydrolase YtcJ